MYKYEWDAEPGVFCCWYITAILLQGGDQVANPQFKDSFFRHIFRQPDELVLLHQALYGDKVAESDITLITLENILLDRLKNDLSYVVQNRRFILCEQQSTINLNMPMRFAMYFSESLKHLIPNAKAMYQTTLIRFPTPFFGVLQMGNTDGQDHNVLRLSSSFIEPQVPEDVRLELLVDVFNIDYSPERAILKKCPTLKDYSYFISEIDIRRKAGFPLDQAIRETVELCREANILRRYLDKEYEEVKNMVTLQYNEEEARQFWRQEAFAEGMERGMEQGTQNTLQRLLDAGVINKADIEKAYAGVAVPTLG